METSQKCLLPWQIWTWLPWQWQVWTWLPWQIWNVVSMLVVSSSGFYACGFFFYRTISNSDMIHFKRRGSVVSSSIELFQTPIWYISNVEVLHVEVLHVCDLQTDNWSSACSHHSSKFCDHYINKSTYNVTPGINQCINQCKPHNNAQKMVCAGQ